LIQSSSHAPELLQAHSQSKNNRKMLAAQRKTIVSSRTSKAAVPPAVSRHVRGSVATNAGLGDALKGVTASLAAALLLANPTPGIASEIAQENINREVDRLPKTAEEGQLMTPVPNLPSFPGGAVKSAASKIKTSLSGDDSGSIGDSVKAAGDTIRGNLRGARDGFTEQVKANAEATADFRNKTDSEQRSGASTSSRNQGLTTVKQGATANTVRDGISWLPSQPLGEVADLGDKAKQVDKKTRGNLVGGANRDRSAELRRVGIEAKRGAGLTGAFRKPSQGFVDQRKSSDADLTAGLKDAGSSIRGAANDAKAGLRRASDKTTSAFDSNPADSVKRTAEKVKQTAKDLVSWAPQDLFEVADLGDAAKQADRKTRDNLVGGANKDRSAQLREVGIEAKRGAGLTGAFRKPNQGAIDQNQGRDLPDLDRAASSVKGSLQRASDKASDALDRNNPADAIKRAAGDVKRSVKNL